MGLELPALVRDPVFRGRGRDRRPWPAGAADPGLHGRRRVAGRDGALAQGHRPPPQPRRHQGERRVLGHDHRAPGGPPRAAGRAPGQARGDRRPQPRRQLRQGAAPSAAPTSCRAIVLLGCPQRTRSPSIPFVRANIEAVAALGRLGVPGFFSENCLDGECCSSFWEHFAAERAARRRLRVGLLAYRRHRALAGLPRSRGGAGGGASRATAAWPCTPTSTARWRMRSPTSAGATPAASRCAAARRSRPSHARPEHLRGERVSEPRSSGWDRCRSRPP